MKPFEPIVPDAFKIIYEYYQFAPAVRSGDLITVSGQLGFSEAMEMPQDFAEQVNNIFAAFGVILEEAGAKLSDIVSLTSYHIGDLHKQMPIFVSIKSKLLGEPHPAWTAVGVAQLAVPGAAIEVSAVARLPHN